MMKDEELLQHGGNTMPVERITILESFVEMVIATVSFLLDLTEFDLIK